jgi:hypothetical protein
MIQFRCWYCRKLYSVANYRVGTFGGMRGLDWIGRRMRDHEQS